MIHRVLILICAFAASGCTISLDGLAKLNVPEPSAVAAARYRQTPGAIAAKTRCLSYYSGTVTTDAASTRRVRRVTLLVLAAVSGATSVASSIISATQSKSDATTTLIAGVSAGAAGVLPLTELIASAFDKDFTDLVQQQVSLETYYNGVALGSIAPASEPGDAVKTAVSVTDNKLANEYGGNFRTKVLNPCMAAITDITTIVPTSPDTARLDGIRLTE